MLFRCVSRIERRERCVRSSSQLPTEISSCLPSGWVGGAVFKDDDELATEVSLCSQWFLETEVGNKIRRWKDLRALTNDKRQGQFLIRNKTPWKQIANQVRVKLLYGNKCWMKRRAGLRMYSHTIALLCREILIWGQILVPVALRVLGNNLAKGFFGRCTHWRKIPFCLMISFHLIRNQVISLIAIRLYY